MKASALCDVNCERENFWLLWICCLFRWVTFTNSGIFHFTWPWLIWTTWSWFYGSFSFISSCRASASTIWRYTFLVYLRLYNEMVQSLYTNLQPSVIPGSGPAVYGLIETILIPTRVVLHTLGFILNVDIFVKPVLMF